MLAPNSSKLLHSKRGRETTKSESKTKISQSIKVLKPKPIKNSNTIFTDKNESDSFISEEEIGDYEEIEEEEEGRQENSLGQLTKNFIRYIKSKGKTNININELVEELTVKKRRIYDITNVLQGIGYIEKNGKNEILWTKNDLNTKSLSKTSINNKKISQFKKQKLEIEQLSKQNIELDKTLNKFKEEFNSISQKIDFPKYSYVTFNDLCKLSKNEQLDLLTVKAPKGTVVNVIDKEDSKKAYIKIQKQMENGKIQKNDRLLNNLRNEFHIFFESPNEQLKLFRITNGEFNEITKSHQQNIFINSNNNNIINESSINNSLISNNNCMDRKQNNSIIFKEKKTSLNNNIPNNINKDSNRLIFLQNNNDSFNSQLSFQESQKISVEEIINKSDINKGTCQKIFPNKTGVFSNHNNKFSFEQETNNLFSNDDNINKNNNSSNNFFNYFHNNNSYNRKNCNNINTNNAQNNYFGLSQMFQQK